LDDFVAYGDDKEGKEAPPIYSSEDEDKSVQKVVPIEKVSNISAQ